MPDNANYQMVITIVEKDASADVIDAACGAGASGATVLHGRGSGIHEKANFFGLTIEPEKDIVIMLVAAHQCDAIMDIIRKELSLDQPNSGVCFAVDVSKVMGLNTKLEK